MFRHRTLFILGAGASNEIGMPTGVNLATLISSKMDIVFSDDGQQVGDGDREIFRQVCSGIPVSSQDCQRAAWLIRDGVQLSNSIDDFLDIHSENKIANRLGKSAIVKTVLEAEAGSWLNFKGRFDRPALDFSRIADTWYVKFIRMLGRGLPRENAREIFNNVAFIVFNYDRCLEYFLLLALQFLYQMPEEEACEILSDLTIIHPYGSAGDLRSSAKPGGVPFGGPHAFSADYFALSDQIRTYSEEILGGGQLNAVRLEVAHAERIIFLGFAFWKQNLNLIIPDKPIAPPIPVFATAHGFSPDDLLVVRTNIGALFGGAQLGTIRLRPELKCAALFDNYAQSLPD
jgi:hypothetical protein